LKNLSGDLAITKDDLAYFLRLVPIGTQPGEVRLERLSLRADAAVPGQYRFSVFIGYHAGRQTIAFQGYLQFLLTVEQAGAQMQIRWPEDAGHTMAIETRQWARKEGILRIPDDATLKKVELRLLQGNVLRATTSAAF
jgi:hypothetical protein